MEGYCEDVFGNSIDLKVQGIFLTGGGVIKMKKKSWS